MKTLLYSNGKFEIEEYSFTNATVLEVDPKFAAEENIIEIFYQVGNLKNCVKYEDGSIKELSDFEPFYNELILLASKFAFEENEILFYQQQTIINTPLPSINLQDLFRVDITTKEQKDLIEILKQVVKESEVNNDFYFKALDKIKKKLLAASDWSQLPDVQSSFSEEEKKAWLEYRASLRELDNIKNPLSARIPLKPN